MLLVVDSILCTLSFPVYFTLWRQFSFVRTRVSLTSLIRVYLTCDHCMFLHKAVNTCSGLCAIYVRWRRQLIHSVVNPFRTLKILTFVTVPLSWLHLFSTYLPVFQFLRKVCLRSAQFSPLSEVASVCTFACGRENSRTVLQKERTQTSKTRDININVEKCNFCYT